MPHFREKSNGDGRRPSPFSASAQRTGVRALRAILSRRSRGLAPFCGQRPHFSPSQGEVLPAPHSLFARKENGPLERSKRERARGIDTHCPTRSAKGPLDPQSRHFCGNAVRHRTAGRARFASAASAAQDGGSSRNGATRVHSIGVPTASAAGNGTMFPRKPLLLGQGDSGWVRALPASWVGCRGAFQLRVGLRASWPRRFFSGTARRHRLFL